MAMASLLAKTIGQSLLVVSAGSCMYHLIGINTGARQLLGGGLIATFIAAQLWLLPAPLPRGNMGSAQIATFFMTCSAFLTLTRLIHFTTVGWNQHSIQSPRPPLSTFLLLYFTAPISVRSLHPTSTALSRYVRALDQPPWRALLKLSLLGLILQFGVANRFPSLDRSLLQFSLTGNLILYLLLSGMGDILSAILEPLLHVQMWPSFDKPWLAVSFKDFWSFRWHSPYADAIVIVLQRSLNPYLPKPLPTALVYLYSGTCHVGLVHFTTGEVSWCMLAFFGLAYLGVLSDPLLARCSKAAPAYARTVVRRAVVIAALSLTSQLFWHAMWQHRFLQGLAATCGVKAGYYVLF